MASNSDRRQRKRMRRAIAALPEPTQSVYRLHLFAGLHYARIGALLDMDVAETERHIAKAIVLIDRALRTPQRKGAR